MHAGRRWRLDTVSLIELLAVVDPAVLILSRAHRRGRWSISSARARQGRQQDRLGARHLDLRVHRTHPVSRLGPRSVNALRRHRARRAHARFRRVPGSRQPDPGRPPGRGLRFPRAERRGQDHHAQDAGRSPLPHGGQAKVAGEAVGSGTSSLGLRRKVGFLAEEPSFYQWMTARSPWCSSGGSSARPTGEARRAPRAPRDGRSCRPREGPHPRLLAEDAPAARHRSGAHGEARGAAARRARLGARPHRAQGDPRPHRFPARTKQPSSCRRTCSTTSSGCPPGSASCGGAAPGARRRWTICCCATPGRCSTSKWPVAERERARRLRAEPGCGRSWAKGGGLRILVADPNGAAAHPRPGSRGAGAPGGVRHGHPHPGGRLHPSHATHRRRDGLDGATSAPSRERGRGMSVLLRKDAQGAVRTRADLVPVHPCFLFLVSASSDRRSYGRSR